MRFVRSVLLGAALAAATALGGEWDPWDIPAPSGAEIMVVLTTSKRTDSYTINLAGKPWEGANGPERVELLLAREEKDSLANCRALLDKGDASATKAIDDVIARNPVDWDAFVLRALALHAAKADADALLALRTSLIGNRRNPEAWKLLDAVAKALGKKVVRPRTDLRGWVRDLGKGEFEMGHVADDAVPMPWLYYAASREHYRHEGPFARDFPEAKAYVFTFREQMYAMGVLAASAADAKKDGDKLPPDLVRVLAEKKAGTLPPFAFFATYPEPLTATPERAFDLLLPRLEKYFDEKIVVKR